MAKTTGLGWTTLTVDDAASVARVLRTDISDVDFSTPRATQDITSIDLSAYERLLLLADFTVTLKGQYNDTPTFSHSVFRSINAGVARRTTMVVAGATLAPMVLYESYDLKRETTGVVNWQAVGNLADGTAPTWS